MSPELMVAEQTRGRRTAEKDTGCRFTVTETANVIVLKPGSPKWSGHAWKHQAIRTDRMGRLTFSGSDSQMPESF